MEEMKREKIDMRKQRGGKREREKRGGRKTEEKEKMRMKQSE